jgi:hypothetical protein
MQLMDRPVGKQINVAWIVNQLKRFNGNLIIQTMFLRGELNGEKIDNTSSFEISAWLDALKEIRPKQVMIYSLDREAPTQGLEKITVDELNQIAEKARLEGFDVSVAG